MSLNIRHYACRPICNTSQIPRRLQLDAFSMHHYESLEREFSLYPRRECISQKLAKPKSDVESDHFVHAWRAMYDWYVWNCGCHCPLDPKPINCYCLETNTLKVLFDVFVLHKLNTHGGYTFINDWLTLWIRVRIIVYVNARKEVAMAHI
jgi:hypothetical protein